MGKRQRNRDRRLVLRKWGWESAKEFRKRRVGAKRAKAVT